MAIVGAQRQADIDFRKLLLVVNAILEVGNRIVAAVSHSEAPSSGKGLQKEVETLQELMLPHHGDAKTKRAAEVKKVLEKVYAGGPLKIKVVGGDREKKRGRVTIRKKD